MLSVPPDVWAWFGDNVLICKLRATCVELSRLAPLALENGAPSARIRGKYCEIRPDRVFIFRSRRVHPVELCAIKAGVSYRGRYYNMPAAEFKYGLAAIYGDTTGVRAVTLVSKGRAIIRGCALVSIAGITLHQSDEGRYKYTLRVSIRVDALRLRVYSRTYSCEYPPHAFAAANTGMWVEV